MDTSRQAQEAIAVKSEPASAVQRQRRSIAEKRRIVEKTLVDGASVARIARAHGVNANQLFGWRRLYLSGRLMLRLHGSYTDFLEKKEEFLHAQSNRQEALENLVHSEIEWLRRGAKARTRKSKARIDKAGELISKLAGLNARTRSATAQIDFTATARKTKRLIGCRMSFARLGIVLCSKG